MGGHSHGALSCCVPSVPRSQLWQHGWRGLEQSACAVRACVSCSGVHEPGPVATSPGQHHVLGQDWGYSST